MDSQTEARRVQIILLDKPGLMRASLAQFLGSQPDLEMIGECGSTDAALAILKESTVDVVLLNSDAFPDAGADLISSAREAGYRRWFLVIAGALDALRAAQAIKLGASGLFLTSDVPDHLTRAIRFVANGDVWIDSAILRSLATQLTGLPAHPRARESAVSLENRERRVVTLVVAGLSNQAIADRTGLSLSMVKNVVQRVFQKTGVRTRSLLVRRVLEGAWGAPHELLLQSSSMKSSPGFDIEPRDTLPAARLSESQLT